MRAVSLHTLCPKTNCFKNNFTIYLFWSNFYRLKLDLLFEPFGMNYSLPRQIGHLGLFATSTFNAYEKTSIDWGWQCFYCACNGGNKELISLSDKQLKIQSICTLCCGCGTLADFFARKKQKSACIPNAMHDATWQSSFSNPPSLRKVVDRVSSHNTYIPNSMVNINTNTGQLIYSKMKAEVSPVSYQNSKRFFAWWSLFSSWAHVCFEQAFWARQRIYVYR